MDIESDLRKIERELETDSKTNNEHYLQQTEEKLNEEEMKLRHDIDM